MTWKNNFDERQRAEIEFCQLYAERFGHGTDGHNAKLIIARFAKMMDEIESIATLLLGETQKPSSLSASIDVTHRLLRVLNKSRLTDE